MATVVDQSLLLDTVRDLYDQGLYVQAHAAGLPLGALADWPGPEGLVLAGRLGGNLGGSRTGHAIHFRSWRKNPQHAETCLFYVFGIFGRFGPWAAWRAHRTC